jgi:dephospho-CoA kinase
MDRPFLVGLTGGLASGKSTVARWLADAGFVVSDADRLVAELYAPGGRGARALAGLLGAEVLDGDGAVDKQAVANRIFADADLRRRVESAIHPLVFERFREVAEAAHRRGVPVVVYEATLLVQSGHADGFDLVVTIEAPYDLRLRRAVARGMAEDDARARLAAQGDRPDHADDTRRRAADVVLDNSGDLDDLRAAVDDLAADLRRRASTDH